MRTQEDARRARRGDARTRRGGGDGRRLPGHRHGPAARRAPSGTRSRCSRRTRRLRAAARRISVSSSSTRPPSCSRSPTSSSTRTVRGLRAEQHHSRTARRSTAYDRWIRAQGGDPDPGAAAPAPVVRPVPAPDDGLRASTAGEGGRRRRDGARRRARTHGDAVDHAVGVVCLPSAARRSQRGEPLAEIHARDEAAAEAASTALLAAYEIGDEPEPRPLVLDVIR